MRLNLKTGSGAGAPETEDLEELGDADHSVTVEVARVARHISLWGS